MSECGTTDVIFILKQIQEKYIGKNCNLYFLFLDLEKAFDRVPRKVLWWALRKADIPERIVCLVQIMSQNTRSWVSTNNLYNNVFKVQVGVHQGSVLCHQLFIIVWSIASRILNWLPMGTFVCWWSSNNCWHYGWTTLQTGFMEKGLEAAGLRVNRCLRWVRPKLWPEAKTCTHSKLCHKEVGSNSIFCDGCPSCIGWKKCSGFTGRLKADPKYRCKRCMSLCTPVDGRPAFSSYIHHNIFSKMWRIRW